MRGRPKVPGEAVYVRLDPDVAEALNKYVGEKSVGPTKVSKNSVINYAVKMFLDDPETHALKNTPASHQ